MPKTFVVVVYTTADSRLPTILTTKSTDEDAATQETVDRMREQMKSLLKSDGDGGYLTIESEEIGNVIVKLKYVSATQVYLIEE